MCEQHHKHQVVIVAKLKLFLRKYLDINSIALKRNPTYEK